MQWDDAYGHTVVSGKREYIDFTSGIFTTNTGHSNKAVAYAIMSALSGPHFTYTYDNVHHTELKEKLTTLAGYEKAHFLSAGTEASECAFKLVREWGEKQGGFKTEIVSFDGAMHGRTMACDMLKGTLRYTDCVSRLPFPTASSCFEDDIDKLEIWDDDYIAGIFLEAYQGWSARQYPYQYIKDVVKFAEKHNILVVWDDIQGGFGRTGKMFSYEHYDIVPDILLLGKALSGCLPISAVLSRSEIMGDDLSSTFGGNPICCAAAVANLGEMDGLPEMSELKGTILHRRLAEMVADNDYVTEINGRGLLAGIVTKSEFYATEVYHRCLERGLILVHTGRESIKIGPPLTITDAALAKGLDILEECL